MNDSDNTTIRQIINVNYAGEFGAIRLYKAQIMIARLFHKDLVATLHQIRQDEQHHCDIFRQIMPNYHLRPCRLTWIWGVAGGFLGAITALLGRRALLICIKAAENTAHTHLAAQSVFLGQKDESLAAVITSIHKDEQNHVALSEAQLGSTPPSFFENLLYNTVYMLCQATMWVVTKGESAQLHKTMREGGTPPRGI